MKKSMNKLLSPEYQKELRERLWAIMYEQELAFEPAAEKITIAIPTIKRFLREEKDVDLVPLIKIEKYVVKEEAAHAKK